MFYKNKKRLQIINYIFNNLDNSEGLSKEFIGKLIYIANKLFLLKYGCTITGDKFIAFERGTTCSETLALMDMDTKHIDNKDNQAIKTFKNTYDVSKRETTQKVHTIFARKKLQNNFSALSEKECEILNITLKRFGKMRDSEISNYTHNFLEWKNYNNRKLLSNNNYVTLDMNDVFNDTTFLNDHLLSKYLDKEQISIAKAIYNGDY